MGDVYIDLDGTLTDPLEGIGKSILYALEKLGAPAVDDETMRRYIGPSLVETFSELVGEEQAWTAVTYYRERFGDVGWQENEPYPGIHEALDKMNVAGHRLFVATAKPRVFAERIVEHFDMADYFEGVHGSELDGTRIDKTELLKYALNVNRSAAAVMIGDREHDAHGASGNGLPFVGVLYGYGSKQELESAGAAALVESPNDLPATVGQLLESADVGGQE